MIGPRSGFGNQKINGNQWGHETLAPLMLAFSNRLLSVTLIGQEFFGGCLRLRCDWLRLIMIIRHFSHLLHYPERCGLVY